MMFPFDQPAPTAFYLTLYLFTMIVHVVFMNYVLAGSAYLAWTSVFRGHQGERYHGALAQTLRDWMPAAISAAITAGVAPLLFVQILYRHDFYSANLLLFHRWMAILPVLVVVFYLAYLLKAKRVVHWPVWTRAVVGLGVFLGLFFVGYSWTENHLLSVESPQFKAQFYASGSMLYANPAIFVRLALWFVGAFPNLALLAAWQLWYAQRRGVEVQTQEIRRCVTVAMLGFFAAGAMAAAVRFVVPDAAWGFAWAAVIGSQTHLLAFLVIALRRRLQAWTLGLASAGALLAVTAATVVREIARVRAVDFAALYSQHAQAMKVGGLATFLIFFVLNAILVAWCFRLVRRGWSDPSNIKESFL